MTTLEAACKVPAAHKTAAPPTMSRGAFFEPEFDPDSLPDYFRRRGGRAERVTVHKVNLE
jgi:hypothetical protein